MLLLSAKPDSLQWTFVLRGAEVRKGKQKCSYHRQELLKSTTIHLIEMWQFTIRAFSMIYRYMKVWIGDIAAPLFCGFSAILFPIDI